MTLIRSLQIIIVDPLFRFLCSISIMKLKNDPHFHIYVVSSVLYCRETKKGHQNMTNFFFLYNHSGSLSDNRFICSNLWIHRSKDNLNCNRNFGTFSPKWICINIQTNRFSSISFYLQLSCTTQGKNSLKMKFTLVLIAFFALIVSWN